MVETNDKQRIVSATLKTDKVDTREKTNDCKESYTLSFLGFEKDRIY